MPPPRGFLLTMGDHLGTLAAARDLGRSGIPVTLATSGPNTLCAQSRYVTRVIESPDPDDDARWMPWLLELGKSEPGHVLYATSDELGWAIDDHRDALSKYFYLYQPRRGAMRALLNKRTLFANAQALGIDQPRQWTPQEAMNDASALSFPVMVKPKTQVGIAANPKGIVAQDACELAIALKKFALRYPHSAAVLAQDPSLADVMVQEFFPEAASHIYSLAGFYAPEKDVFLVRAAEKILQQPLRVGVGLCFESREVNEDLARQLRALMDQVGYRGAFEVEFVHLQAEGRFLLIDFNPRFYGQMGFEAARGLPIAKLCYLAAIGDGDGFRALATEAGEWRDDRTWHYRHGWMLRLYVTTHLLGGSIPRSEWSSWLKWGQHSPCSDPVLADDDPVPAAASRRNVARSLLRHPRSTLRRFFSTRGI